MNLGISASRVSILISSIAAMALFAATVGAQTPEDRVTSLPSPEDYFGHVMAEDRTLVHYDEFLPYYELLAQGSDRVEMRRLGTTTQGRDLVMLLISTPENLALTERYREISGSLNDPRGLSEEAVDALVDEGKVILLVTMNIHSSEIVSSQTGLELAFRLATGDEKSAAQYLKDVIVLLVPSMNPDGQALITEWYRKHLRTPFEGGSMPWLYHTYAGHDNNRDWFMLNLTETRAVNRVAYHDWFPQILVDVHQMGATGPRAFVPPYTDPISEKIHPLIHRGTMLLGASMAMDCEQEEKSGVIYGYSFDAYWPGGTRSTPSWKNTVGVLIEIASTRVMSPIYVDPGELAGGRKGLPDYQAQINFPNPWPGGWWRPRDILEYQTTMIESAIKTSSYYREDYLRNRAHMAMDAVKEGETTPPYGYVIPSTQHDPGTATKLVDLLRENGLEVFRATKDLFVPPHVIRAGSFVVPAAQPYRSFLVEMMDPQIYPEVRVALSSEEIYRPYDVTSWTLPYLMGIDTFFLDTHLVWAEGMLEKVENSGWAKPALVEGPGDNWALSPTHNDSYTAVLRLLDAGESVLQTRSSFENGAAHWPAGTFFTTASASTMEQALDGLCVQAHAMEKPTPTGDAPTSLEPEGLVSRSFRILTAPRIGIYQSWLASMDEGWTRYVLDSFEFPVTVLHDEDIQKGSLNRSFDVILLPDLNRSQLVDGKRSTRPGRYEEPRPRPYNGGLGEKGVSSLDSFVQRGGTLITLGNAAELAIQDLNIPVQNVTAGLSAKDFSTPGAILRVEINIQHPLGYGMPEEALIYHTTDPVLGTQVPGPGSERRVVARYAHGDDVVASGWATGVRALERKGALVEASSGDGKVVLFGFRPQHRAQTHGTYRMLFNAILDSGTK